MYCSIYFFFFFFNDTATTEIYTLSLHDALPISIKAGTSTHRAFTFALEEVCHSLALQIVADGEGARSEEHTSELQSRLHLVCRLLLEKKKIIRQPQHRLIRLVDMMTDT